MCRWYSQNTKKFVQDYDIDKLDDIADSLLIVLAALRYLTNFTSQQNDIWCVKFYMGCKFYDMLYGVLINVLKLACKV